jgi:molecular chaperone GrpE
MANADGTTETPQSLPDEDSSDIMNSPAFLKRKLEILQADIAKAEEDIVNAKEELSRGKEEWGGKLDALNREYLTAQERAIKQNEESGDKATAEVAKKILEVLDNYDRAFSSVTPSSDFEKEVEAAYKATYDSILATFNELGIKEVECVGKEFDYELHNAVMMRPSEDYEEGVVIEELAKGYIMGEDLIRAAMVIVAA